MFKDVSYLCILRYNIYSSLLARRYVHGSTNCTDRTNCLLHHLYCFLFLCKVPLFFAYRPCRYHYAFFLILQVAENFFCNKRNKWMKKLQCPNCSCLRLIAIVPQTWLNHLNVPVTELFPYEIIYLLKSNTHLVAVKIFCYFLNQTVALCQNPLICHSQIFQWNIVCWCLFHVHHDKAWCIPDLVCKVSWCLNTLIVETHIVSWCVSCHKCHTKCISAVLVNNFKRINSVSKWFTHLAALWVSYKTMNQYSMEWLLSCMLNTWEYHTDNPEENDIISCYKNVCRIEIFVLWCLLWPAKCREWP